MSMAPSNSNTKSGDPGALSKEGAIAAGVAAGAGAAALAGMLLSGQSAAHLPHIVVADGPLKSSVLPYCKALLQPFKPTPWASNSHAQTMLGLLRKVTARNIYTRQLLLGEDGGTFALDWYQGCNERSFAPAVVPILMVCHGINGGSHEGYCKWVCSEAVAKGWRAVVINYRGCNGLQLTSPRGYTATMTRDVHIAVESIKALYPAAPLCAVGYSLGGLILTKYLAEADLGLHGPCTHATTPDQAPAQGKAAQGKATPKADGSSSSTSPTWRHVPGSSSGAGGSHASSGRLPSHANDAATHGSPAADGTAADKDGQEPTPASTNQQGRSGSIPKIQLPQISLPWRLSAPGHAAAHAAASASVPHPAGAKRGIVAAAVVSSPVCMWRSSDKLSKPWSFNLIYNFALAYKLREYISEHARAIRAHTRLDVDNALTSWTVQQVEDCGVAAVGGFSSRHHYYEEASSLQYLPHIATPTLLLLAKDDPFLGTVPDVECALNPHTMLALTEHGGHVAFLQGMWPLGKAYMDTAVLQFMENTLEHYPYTHAQLQQGGQASATPSPSPPPLGGSVISANAVSDGTYEAQAHIQRAEMPIARSRL